MGTTKIDYRALRKRLNLNQSEFWSRINVTQSGGSRYESGRDAPDQVKELVRLHYLLGVDTTRINARNAEIICEVLSVLEAKLASPSELLAAVRAAAGLGCKPKKKAA